MMLPPPQTILVLAGLGLLVSCRPIEPVQPWQKGTLAREEMTMEGGDVLGARSLDHVYDSREAASGGGRVGGGGCGCN
ncbi:DUF4266 domain-containing protein [Noviherbaspirillum galbum]|uniref:DUF4266 domain-containing protein n=1 Tax=Noviherbaspirillum galbum TaxID=2709383 RepID=A0A6B3SZI7_9BURK|nr:DUF4266 domain-containing protein [Noviherbaspirillum galbum]NEX64752.1 DUF4266 domain-containing protein [Noviherbaspirillum galbum]